MRPLLIIRVMAIAFMLGVGSAALHAQSWQMPSDAERCPSKLGTNDEMNAAGGSELGAGARQGFPKLGVQHVPDMMTRGVLIDVAGLKNVEMLPETYVISADDLQQALAKEKVTLQSGDAVMINTGWGKLYNEKDKARYLKTSPGIGIEAGEWLIKQNQVLAGADNGRLEVRPY